MTRSPGMRTSDKTCIERVRLVKSEEPRKPMADQPGVFLELWEGTGSSPQRQWAVAVMDDYRPHLAAGIRVRVDDGVAGYLRREFGPTNGENGGDA